MYPLLISAATSLATTLIDKWSEARAAKAETTAATTAATSTAKTSASTETFASSLSKSTAASTDTQIAALRKRLLDSPEVRTLLASADPTKQPTLSLAADGTLTARAADGRTTTVTLSAETATAAKDLATLTAAKVVSTAPSTGKNLPDSTFPITL